MLRPFRSLLTVSVSSLFLVPTTYAEIATTELNNTNSSQTTRNQDQAISHRIIEPDNSPHKPNFDQCIVTPKKTDQNQEPIYVKSDNLEATNGDKAMYRGDVVIVQGQKNIRADSVTLHHQDNIIVAEGNVQFSDGQIKTTSTRATNNLTTNELTLENTHYQFLCEAGRGDAIYIAQNGKSFYQIQDGSITSCPNQDNSWQLRASSIDIDQTKEEATFFNPRFEILHVPVFYLPYLTVPIGNTRKTGFLYPSVSYGSRDGFEMEVPIYWNLAPQYDLETTIKFMQRRGTQLNSKFRYLSDLGSGSIISEYLDSDEEYPEESNRWGFQYQHSGIFHEAWKFDIDYSKVSDINYFSDLSSGIGNREDGQLIQEGQITYRTTSWDTSILFRDFQLLLDEHRLSSEPYQLLPRIEFNYYAPRVTQYLDFDLKSHISRFDISNQKRPVATRVHVEPGLTLPISAPWGEWTTEARVLGTYYQQDLRDYSSATRELDEDVTRVLPQFSSNAKLIFERNTAVIDDYSQTLEPQIQYVYIPEEDQSNIYDYDTSLLQTDYYGLFRDRKYSSVDKIAATDQISYGATSRFYDSSYKERLNISFGQIYYLDKKTRINNSNDESSNYSSWALETDFNYADNIFYHGGIQYDTNGGTMQLANSTLEYRFKEGFIQTNYRYVTKEYIEETVSGINENNWQSIMSKDGISQAGLLTGYQLTPKLRFTGQYFYDLNEEVSLEWLANLNYRTDCWYIGITYDHQLKRWDDHKGNNNNSYGTPNADPVYDHNLSFNFGIIGFGTAIGSEDAGLTETNNTLGYGRPFFLNN